MDKHSKHAQIICDISEGMTDGHIAIKGHNSQDQENRGRNEKVGEGFVEGIQRQK